MAKELLTSPKYKLALDIYNPKNKELIRDYYNRNSIGDIKKITGILSKGLSRLSIQRHNSFESKYECFTKLKTYVDSKKLFESINEVLLV